MEGTTPGVTLAVANPALSHHSDTAWYLLQNSSWEAGNQSQQLFYFIHQFSYLPGEFGDASMKTRPARLLRSLTQFRDSQWGHTSLEQPDVFLGTLQRRNLLSQLSLWSCLAQKDLINELL